MKKDKKCCRCHQSMPNESQLTPLESAFKSLIKQILLKHNGNLTRTADELGISRPTTYKHAVRHGLWPWKKD